MSILSILDNFMVNKSDYYMIENSTKSRIYRRKWMQLEEVAFKETFNGECLEITVPIGEIQYYTRFRLNELDENIILNYLDNKID
jgi:hypothetical protein